MDKIDHAIGHIVIDWLQWGDEWDEEVAAIGLKYMSQLISEVKNQDAEITQLREMLAIAKDALTPYAMTSDTFKEYGEVARHALDRIAVIEQRGVEG